MSTLLFILLTIQILYYIFFYINFNKKEKYRKDYCPGISVIICAKNEAKNLEKHLPLIAAQQYTDFEIIVVDDASDDDTPNVLEKLKTDIPNLKSIRINKGEKTGAGKKYIISKAVETAKNEVLAFTDADCFPASGRWLQVMANHLYCFDIVLGIAPLVKSENNFTAQLQVYETAQTLLQYTAMAKAGNPYMAVGRNLMIRKSAYLKNAWTKKELELASGDDDLLIQKIATSSNTNTCTDNESFVFSYAKKNYTEWTQQKIRHYSAGFLYKTKDKMILSIFMLSKAFLYIACLLNCRFIFLLIIYLVIITFIYKSIENIYKIETSWKKVFILDVFLIFNSIILGISNQFKINRKWK
jgi:glycosyltransferase involved in cell wall biosynthesis